VETVFVRESCNLLLHAASTESGRAQKSAALPAVPGLSPQAVAQIEPRMDTNEHE